MSGDNLVRIEMAGDIAVVVIGNPPVNAGSTDVRKGLKAAIETIAADSATKAAVLIGAGKTFIAGSDLREFGKPLAEPQMPAVVAAIETCPKPVVAAIHGAALGGGYEIALGCDARIATPDAIVGLPEVRLGMIPGAGGTQRLPRLTGTAKAIELITAGRHVPAPEAAKLGMVDRLAEGNLRDDAIALARTARKRRLADMPLPDEPEAEIENAATAAQPKARGRRSIAAAIEATRRATTMSFADAIAAERETFQALRTSDEAAALRYLFFAERKAGRVDAADVPRIRATAVIGAGTMGTGIAIILAGAGFPVVLVESNVEALERARSRIESTFRKQAETCRITDAEATESNARINATTDLAAMRDADLVIDAVFEDLAVKTGLMAELDRLAKPEAILASNTSYLDLDAIAAATDRPERVVGLHFIAPANIMRLLEIVRGKSTSGPTLAAATAFGRRIGKLPIIAGNSFGFIGNRIYAAYRRQCEILVEDGAWPEDVDAAIEGFGFAMGPFRVADLTGLDVAWRMRKSRAASRDPHERYVTIADRLCEAGRLGQKTGAGWYAYPEDARRGAVDPLVRDIIETASTDKGIARRPVPAEEIVARALGAIVNEAAIVLEDGITERASDIDLALVNGYGFPDTRGGPLYWARSRPMSEIEAAIDHVEAAVGFGFRRGDVPAALAAIDA